MKKIFLLFLFLGAFLPAQSKVIEKPQDDPEIITIERQIKEVATQTGRLQNTLGQKKTDKEKRDIRKKIKINEKKLEKLAQRYQEIMERFNQRS